jgi:hypothetical protein
MIFHVICVELNRKISTAVSVQTSHQGNLNLGDNVEMAAENVTWIPKWARYWLPVPYRHKHWPAMTRRLEVGIGQRRKEKREYWSSARWDSGRSVGKKRYLLTVQAKYIQVQWYGTWLLDRILSQFNPVDTLAIYLLYIVHCTGIYTSPHNEVIKSFIHINEM